MSSDIDIKMMRKALKLAIKGKAWVSPNPMVGAIIVNEGEVVGKGYHRKYGGPHAEVYALNRAGDKAKGATMYVTLEPCCHYGKTPPCTERIIEAGIKRVVTCMQDPYLEVAGKGIDTLKEAGITVEVGLLEDNARKINEHFLKKADTGKCWVTLKMAQTVDGKIATSTGHSKWITCEKSRKKVHMLRAMHDAILVGAGTVNADDPSLTVRNVKGKNPVRVVLDTNLTISPDCKLLNSPEDAQTLIFTAVEDTSRLPSGNGSNVKIFNVDKDGEENLNVNQVLEILSDEGIGAVLVEGGSKIWTSFLNNGLVDAVDIFVAPMLMGEGISTIGNLSIEKVSEAVKLKNFQWEKVDKDIHFFATIDHNPVKEAE
jgi:diaminohydroxyphosphoribosylaminopyrimidine deaminase / 5-amino-6-(5-phosphoribosylamino)uracil reductase